jgi:hypothetical protein
MMGNFTMAKQYIIRHEDEFGDLVHADEVEKDLLEKAYEMVRENTQEDFMTRPKVLSSTFYSPEELVMQDLHRRQHNQVYDHLGGVQDDSEMQNTYIDSAFVYPVVK